MLISPIKRQKINLLSIEIFLNIKDWAPGCIKTKIMKLITQSYLVILIALLVLTGSCDTKTTEKHYTSSFEFNLKGDTINLTDCNGRQSIWIMRYSKDTMVYLNDTGYSAKTITSGEIMRNLKVHGNKNVMALPDSLAVRSN